MDHIQIQISCRSEIWIVRHYINLTFSSFYHYCVHLCLCKFSQDLYSFSPSLLLNFVGFFTHKLAIFKICRNFMISQNSLILSFWGKKNSLSTIFVFSKQMSFRGSQRLNTNLVRIGLWRCSRFRWVTKDWICVSDVKSLLT